jgi:DNA-binding transcriptional ArsR family regulator
MTMDRGDEQAHDWSALVPRIVHPAQEAVIEALLWVEQPLSATDFGNLLDDPALSVSRISYHLDALARKGILAMTRQRGSGGAVERRYFLVTKPRRAETTD